MANFSKKRIPNILKTSLRPATSGIVFTRKGMSSQSLTELSMNASRQISIETGLQNGDRNKLEPDRIPFPCSKSMPSLNSFLPTKTFFPGTVFIPTAPPETFS